MKQITTKDGSITYYSKKYGETYHSTSGAVEEALEKFAKPCKLKDGMDALDICFGLGYNSLAAISLADVNITALENDPAILEKIRFNRIFNNANTKNDKIKNTSLKNQIMLNYGKIKRAAANLEYFDGRISIKIVLGDARRTIEKFYKKFDAVFLDPFSPKKCPELWTEDFFGSIREVMKDGAVLATYSCSRSVRQNMIKARFSVKDGPIVGRRSPGTLACNCQ